VDWFSIISALLLVPPIGMRISKLSFNWRRVDVSSILRSGSARSSEEGFGGLTIPGSSASVFPLACQLSLQAISKNPESRGYPLTNEGYSGPACTIPRCGAKAVRRAIGKAARSGRAVAIRQESICIESQRVQLVIQASFARFYLCWSSPRLDES
jgi:hypothetical protein